MIRAEKMGKWLYREATAEERERHQRIRLSEKGDYTPRHRRGM